MFKIALILFCMADLESAIQNLHNKDVKIRDAATQELIDLGYPAAIELESQYDKFKGEVKTRARTVINYYYKECKDIPSIWDLPKEARFNGEEDLGVKYYKMVRDEYKPYVEDARCPVSWYDTQEDRWISPYIEREATRRLFCDMLKKEDCRTVIINIKCQSEVLRKEHDKLRYMFIECYWQANKPPRAIEIEIEENKSLMGIVD